MIGTLQHLPPTTRYMPMRLLQIPSVALLLALGGCAAAPTGQPPASAPGPDQPFNVLGREDAPVTIIEFTDLECPYCARFATQTFPELRRTYIDTGRVRFATRDLPLPMHPNAVPSAVAARCAGEQGRFWEFREALFEAQSKPGRPPYDELARRLSLDPGKFAACRGDGRQAANVRADAELARSHGLTGTPSFIVGRLVDGEFQGETIEGAQPYAAFAARIDALLEAAR